MINENKIINLIPTENYDSSVQEFYLKKFNELKFVNGGSTESNYHCNTCSIDYFLAIAYVIAEHDNSQYIDDTLFEIFKKINLSLKKNDWNQARINWRNFETNTSKDERFPKVEKENSNEKYDWFGSQYDAFLATYRHFQTCFWQIDCTNIQECKNHRVDTASAFILK
jgi:hypothetical protein